MNNWTPDQIETVSTTFAEVFGVAGDSRVTHFGELECRAGVCRISLVGGDDGTMAIGECDECEVSTACLDDWRRALEAVVAMLIAGRGIVGVSGMARA